MKFLRKALRRKGSGARSSQRTQLRVEVLETRVVPYAVTGDAWPSPQLITISFVPDGTLVGSNNNGPVYSNLFSVFNTKWGSASTWENVILKAAQAWAQQTNINFAVISDDGTALGGGNYQQGAPNFGDIRISGYNIGAGILGVAAMPPPDNNDSFAGDIALNTAQNFNIGATYDLFTVATHEIGHALGLDHSVSSSAIMYANYTSTKYALSTDDTNGIRAIYSSGSARSADIYDSVASNGTFSTATNVNSLVNTSTLTALVTGVDITTTSDLDYYTVTAPSGSSQLTVNVQSSGLSQLSPAVSVYSSSQTLLGSSSSAAYGATVSVSLSSVSSGTQFYIKVAGANTSSFGTGAYGMTLNFGTGSSPTVPIPNTQLANSGSQGGDTENDTVPVVTDNFPDDPVEVAASVGKPTTTENTQPALAATHPMDTTQVTLVSPTTRVHDLVAASLVASQASTTVSLPVTPSSAFVALIQPTTAPLIPLVPAASSLPSGGGEDVQVDNNDQPAPAIPASVPQLRLDPVQEVRTGPKALQRASDSYFAGQVAEETPAADAGSLPSEASSEPVVPFDRAGALAGLAIVLGSFGARVEDPAEKRKRLRR